MSPYSDREKQKAYMRDYARKKREMLKTLFTAKQADEIKAYAKTLGVDIQKDGKLQFKKKEARKGEK